MKIVLAPDKFKGSIDAISLCKQLHQEIVSLYPDAEVVSFPMADGGDGFSSIVRHYLDTSTVSAKTVDPLGRTITAGYEYSEERATAYIEMAAASGLALLKPSEYNAMRTSSYGTGLLIRDAMARGARHIVLGIGGSATTDGGMGMADALGFMFLDRNEEPLDPCGESLTRVEEIVQPETDFLEDVQFTVACDVRNPFYGPNGAAYVYGPQKGATPEEVKELDEGLKKLDGAFMKYMGRSVAEEPGAGAAGGLGGACDALLGARLVSGFDHLTDIVDLEEAIAEADCVVTGEGRVDSQSFDGKVVGRVAEFARKFSVKVYVICGASALTLKELNPLGVDRMVALSNEAESIQDSIAHPEKYIPAAVKKIF